MSHSETNTEAAAATENETTLEDLRDDEVPNRYVDGLITLGFLVGAVAFLYLSGNLSGIRGSSYDPGAAFWPRITLGIVLLAGVINLGIVAWNLRRENRSVVPEFGGVRTQTNDAIAGVPGENRQFYLAVVAVFLYVMGLTPTGFIFATPLFLFAFAWIAGYRYPVKLAVFSVFITLLLFGLFRSMFNISLPFGNGVFRQLSLFFEMLFNTYLP